MRVTHRRTNPWIATLSVVAVLATSQIAQAEPERESECKTLNGFFTSVLLPPPGCTSPVGICTLGTLTGHFRGTYSFVMDSLFPANDDADHPNKLYYTGHSVITRAHGGATLIGQDSGVMYFDPIGTSPFVTTVQIVDGTKRFRRASGQFVASGQLTFATGGGAGIYVASICNEEDE